MGVRNPPPQKKEISGKNKLLCSSFRTNARKKCRDVGRTPCACLHKFTTHSQKLQFCTFMYFADRISAALRRKFGASPPPCSEEKGQVDGAICGLQAAHKTASLCAEPFYYYGPPYKCKWPARATRLCMLLNLHAHYVAISCPENAC